jgi:hypothetical protein
MKYILYIITLSLFSISIGYGQNYVIPNAGATETFDVNVGDIFTSPGGPGGNCASGGASPPNYPNCGCATVTTITGVDAIEFLEFSVFGNFDYLEIYDGTDLSGPKVFDNRDFGPAWVQFSDVVAEFGNPPVINSSTGSLTFYFWATTVVNRCGYEILIQSGSGGGDCDIECPADISVSNDPGQCGAFVNVPAPEFIGPDCGGTSSTIVVLDENFNSCVQPTGWTNTTTSTGSTTPGDCRDALFSYSCNSNDPAPFWMSNPGYPANFDGCFALIDDDAATSAAVGVHCIETPVMDLSAGGVELTFDFLTRDFLSDGILLVEAWNGSTWELIFSQGGIANGSEETVSLDGFNNSDFQIRFCYDDEGGFSYGAAIDNVIVTAIDPDADPEPPEVVNDYNGTENASDFYPVGTTTVTFSADGVGSCEFNISVEDSEPPTLNCPSDIVETLNPGECDRVVNFEVSMTDNCPLIGGANSLWGFEPSTSTGNNIWYGVSFDLTNLTTDVIIVDYVTQPIPNLGTREYQLHATTTVNTNVGNLGNPGVWELIGTADVTATTVGNLNDPSTFTEIPIGGLELQPGQTRGVILWTPDAGGFTYANAFGLVSPHDNGELQMHLNGCSINAGGPYTCTFGPSRGFTGEVFYSRGVAAGDVIQTVGDTSGTILLPGTYTNCFEAEDAAGNIGECCFDIVIQEFPNPTNVLVCNDFVNISLDPIDCEGHVNADMILEGGPYKCYNDYEINMETLGGLPVSNPITGDLVGETIVVSVEDPDTGNSCWGYVLVEDKTIPDLVCGVHTVGCDAELNPGSAFAEDIFLTASHNLDDVIFGNAVACPTFDYSYLRVIDLPANGVTGEFSPEEFSMGVESSAGGINVTLKFYVFDDPSSYDPTAPGFSYDDLTQIGPDNEATIPALNLDFWSMPVEDVTIPGGNQYLVWELVAPPGGGASFIMGSNTDGEDTPTYFAASNIACADTEPFILANLGFQGNWVSWVTGETSGGLPFPFDDEDVVITPSSGEGPFTVTNWDACGPATLTFEDEIESFECDDDFASIINRHWVAVDGSGNTSECTQIIQVQHGNLSDFEAPPTWYADCSDNFDLDDYGNPHPSESGSPISDACENIVGSYTDVRIDDDCGGYKIIRTWTLLDWCTLEAVELTQLLKVLNEEAPEFLDCPDPGTIVNVSARFNDCVGDYIAQQLTAINNCTGEEITDIVVTASAGTVVWNQQIQRYQVLNCLWVSIPLPIQLMTDATILQSVPIS